MQPWGFTKGLTEQEVFQPFGATEVVHAAGVFILSLL